MVEQRRSNDGPSKMIQSVQRALRIMELVGKHREGVSAPRIAFECGLNRATVYNLLRTLVHEGYLCRGYDGRYTLGLELSDRYSELTQAMAGPRTAGEFMRRMSTETGYSTFVARFVEGRPAVTAVTEGNRSPHVEDLIVGFDDGAHATALGKALLGTLEPREREAFLKDAGMRPFTGRTLTEPEALEHDLLVAGSPGCTPSSGSSRRASVARRWWCATARTRPAGWCWPRRCRWTTRAGSGPSSPSGCAAPQWSCSRCFSRSRRPGRAGPG
ncbi:hypothetical protein GCM10029992_20960 [Glycomyces albus]